MKPGILVISHGSREQEWIRQVDHAVRTAAAELEPAGMPVVSSFLEIVEGRLIQDGIDELERLGVTDVLVIPLFVSSGSTHVDEIGQAFGLKPVAHLEGELDAFRVQSRIDFGRPIDDDDDIAELLLSNIMELSAAPHEEALLLVAHGSEAPVFYDRYIYGLTSLAQRMKALGGFARAECALLLPDQAAAKLAQMRKQRPDEAVIVVPLFLSPGYFTKHVIPKRLEGHSYRYNGRAMLPHSAISRWISRQAAEWLHNRDGSNKG